MAATWKRFAYYEDIDLYIQRNKQESDTNYTLGPSENGLVVGPWTVANGKTFTITDGCVLVVL